MDNCASIKNAESDDSNSSADHYMQYTLPDEVLLAIFEYLKENDLCRVAQVCKRFHRISSDLELWKTIYQNLFEYDNPLYRRGAGKFEFVNEDDTDYDNPWKESIQQLYHGIHVRPNYRHLYNDKQSGRFIFYADTIQNAIILGMIQDALSISSNKPLIFIHAHDQQYVGESIVIGTNVEVIGASRGNVAENVIIRSSEESTVGFVEGSSDAYLGYLTIKFIPQDIYTDNYCLHLERNTSPTISHCIIQSLSPDLPAVLVEGYGANPHIEFCDISECESRGICFTDYAQGTFENNEIGRNLGTGILVENFANPMGSGIFIYNNGLGFFESNDIHDNKLSGIEVKGANPMVVQCEIHHNRRNGISVRNNGEGQFLENRIYSNDSAGVRISYSSHPTIRGNEIYKGNHAGIFIQFEGRGLIEQNNIHSNAYAGIEILTKSDPVVRNNKIHSGQSIGIYVHKESQGLIEENEVYANSLEGVLVESAAAPTLRRNHIHSGEQSGVWFRNNGNGKLEKNEISNNSYAEIEISSGSNPTIRENKIWGGEGYGVLVHESGLGLLENNEIFYNNSPEVCITEGSNSILRRNKIFSGRRAGIVIFKGGRGILEENEISKNGGPGVVISTQSDSILRRNRIFDGNEAGIEIWSSSFATLEENEIFHNRFAGLSVARGVFPICTKNEIYGNDEVLEKVIEEGHCSFKVTSNTSFPMHDNYQCQTCGTTDGQTICVNCINTCHSGHEIEFVKCSGCFCDCGADLLSNKCKLQEPTQNTDMPPKLMAHGTHQSPLAE